MRQYPRRAPLRLTYRFAAWSSFGFLSGLVVDAECGVLIAAVWGTLRGDWTDFHSIVTFVATGTAAVGALIAATVAVVGVETDGCDSDAWWLQITIDAGERHGGLSPTNAPGQGRRQPRGGRHGVAR